MTTDRSVDLGLQEQASSSQKEVRWLSLRCLSHLGQFRDLVTSLGDTAHRLVWPDYIDELRSAIARSPETAASVHADLEKQYPQQAAELYRMLWGYTDEDLQAGEADNLVRALEDRSLAVRVLSIWNLHDITRASHGYQPEQPAAKRLPSVRRWNQWLKEQKLQWHNNEEKSAAPRSAS